MPAARPERADALALDKTHGSARIKRIPCKCRRAMRDACKESLCRLFAKPLVVKRDRRERGIDDSADVIAAESHDGYFLRHADRALVQVAQDAERDAVRRADEDSRMEGACFSRALIGGKKVKPRLDEINVRPALGAKPVLESLPALDADGVVGVRHAYEDGAPMPHLAQVGSHHVSCRRIIDLEAMDFRAALPRKEDRDPRVLGERDVRVGDRDAVDEDAVDALLAEALDMLDFLLRIELAHEQDALIARRVEHAAHARQQPSYRDGVHARQDDADKLARLGLEPPCKEV